MTATSSAKPKVTARLDSQMIAKVINGFPNKSGWSTVNCREFTREVETPPRRRRYDWTHLKQEIGSAAGLYVFLFPINAFPRPLAFELHGPSSKRKPRKLRFAVSTAELPAVKPRRFAAYVGRSANLGERLPLHFYATKSTTAAQVRKSLEQCLHLDVAAAIAFMCEHAVLAYYLLPGDANVANRDIIEVALWAKYRTPFNIKSER